MVRRDEQPRQNRAALLLDTRRVAHRGEGTGASFEWAVSAAASIGAWLTHRGYSLRLTTTAGVNTGAASPAVAENLLLDALAVVSLSAERHVDEGLRGLTGQGGGGLVVAVLGIVDAQAVETLARVPATASGAAVVLVDAAGWAGTTPRSKTQAQEALRYARDALSASGWRPVVARHGEDLRQLWPEAGRRPAGHFGGAA